MKNILIILFKIKNYFRILSCMLSISLLHLAAYSQQKQVKVPDRRLLHYEVKEDDYLSNKFNNKKTSPAYKFNNGNTNRVVHTTTILTTQVNVDAAGDNIFNDAANEPSIAINPLNTDQIVIGWRQFDDIASNFRQAGWSYSSDGGQTWNFTGDIEQGIFRSDPVLDYDDDGNIYYNSLSRDSAGNFICKVFKSNDGGSTWDAGVDAHGGDKQWMTIDRTNGTGNDNIYSFWTRDYSSCFPEHFTRSENNAVSFDNCIAVDGDPALGTMSVGINGEVYIAGTDTFSQIVVAKSSNAQLPGSSIAWDAPVTVDLDGYLGGWGGVNPVGLFGQVNIETDHSTGAGQGNVYVLAPVARISNFDPCDIMFSRSIDGGATWSTAVRINDDASITNTQWFGTMSVAPNGRIDVVWLDTRDNPGYDSSALYYSYSTDQGTTWSANEKLSASFDPHVGYPSQDKMGDYYDMISYNNGAHLAWSNTLNGEEDVYYSFIVPPVATTLNEIHSNQIVSASPNPSAGVFNIALKENNSLLIAYSAWGDLVYSARADKRFATINLASQPAGIYFIKVINTEGVVAITKLVKE